MPRDYRLYELTDTEFEGLVVRICVRWLGEGVTPFAPGKDGGRDGKFNGTAVPFPSPNDPLSGHFVLQAKHVSQPGRSCSDSDFARILKAEHRKITRLSKEGICDHYLAFTNRRLPAGADERHIKSIAALGPRTAHIIGMERIHLALDDNPTIARELPNRYDTTTFRFNAEDLVEVIGALHDYVGSSEATEFESATDFERIRVRTEKNKINGLSEGFWNEIIVSSSMPHFRSITAFLRNRRNASIAHLYYDTADELKQKIFVHRDEFESFDKIFPFLYDQIQQRRDALRGKRRMISVLLHYMYYMCDIGSKVASPPRETVDADT
jgi:hypothetical protein